MKRSKMTSFIPGLGIHNICISIESKLDFGSIDVYIEVIQGQKRSFKVKNGHETVENDKFYPWALNTQYMHINRKQI